MKKLISYLLATALLATVFTNYTLAQNLNKDALAFAKTYQENYNKGNLPALMELYSNEINVVYSSGEQEKVPKSDFEADYIRYFGESAGTFMEIKTTGSEKLADGKIKLTGTFDGYDYDRKSNTKLNPISGNYEHIIAKEGDKWKFVQIKTVYAMEQLIRDTRKLTQAFQDACNKEDAATLRTLFTSGATRTRQDGNTVSGVDNVVKQYQESFDDGSASVTIKPSNLIAQFDGSMIATGSYIVYGISAKGDRISRSGSYTNKLVKEGDQWKIAEIKQGKLAKVIVHHKAGDYAAWRKSFDAFRRARRDAGELTFEVATLADDPNTICVISEWASVEKAKAFFALPDLAEHRKKAGQTEPLNIIYLDTKQ